MKGDVIIIPFPFSDLSGSKKRPALVIADWGGNDLVCCQITSKAHYDGMEVALSLTDFEKGALPVVSNIRPNKIFTVYKPLITQTAGSVSHAKYNEVIQVIKTLIS